MEGGGEARAQRRQDQVGALVAEGLVQPAQAIDVGHHQIIGAGRGQPFAGLGDEAAPVQKPGERVPPGGAEPDLLGDDACSAKAFLQPDAAPQACLGAAHSKPGRDLDSRLADPENFLGGGAVLRQHQGAQCGGRGFRRQGTQAQGPGRAIEAQAIALRLPEPQRHVGGAQGLQNGGRVPQQSFRGRHDPPRRSEGRRWS